MKEPKEKEPTVIRNRYLDDALGIRRAALGRSSLRIDPGSARKAPGSSGFVDYGSPIQAPISGKKGGSNFGDLLKIGIGGGN